MYKNKIFVLLRPFLWLHEAPLYVTDVDHKTPGDDIFSGSTSIGNFLPNFVTSVFIHYIFSNIHLKMNKLIFLHPSFDLIYLFVRHIAY